MKDTERLYDDIRILAGVATVTAAKPFGDPKPEADSYKAAANAKLAERVLSDLTGVSAQWLGNATPIFEGLIAKAQDGQVTDDDFIDAVESAAVAMPDLFDRLDWQSLAVAISRVSEEAAVNGAVAKERDFRTANIG